ncbi:MAG TPA: hypothetical protein VHY48_06545 [Acidobacteriaceae bacterium]|jgi:hypothetical protein|nr:hypothetical protein [Acidobacteriaceae bacterium]
MLEPYRSEFNARFTEEKYAELLRLLEERIGTRVEFRVAETPCFFAPEMMERLVRTGVELTEQLLGNAQYMRASDAAIPAEFYAPGENEHPHFMTVDFGLVRNEAGELQPKLVEMQAFPSIFGYQPVLAEAYREVFGLDAGLEDLLGGLDDAGYWAVMREVIVGAHDPENVVLLEVEPETQKTLPDFRVHERRLGIRVVDIAKVVKQGKRLFYRNEENGALVRIERIYNRAIVDELVREKVRVPFDYREELEVEWAGHPNWYFRISKFSIPYLKHPAVPAAVFLDDWFAGEGKDRMSQDRSRWVFKPLYSFAGKGIQFAPTDVELEAIPAAERHNYLLQERVQFEPVIRTPEGMTQAEIRILYAWPDGGAMTPMTSLVRMGRGLMMGVDHNRDRRWVGGSAALIPKVKP